MVRAGLTMERLIEVGGKLADEIGFDAVTPTVLANVVGVRTASLYSHFASIDQLKKGIALLALDRLAGDVAQAIAGRSGRDAVVALANAHRDFAREHPGLFVAARYPLDPEMAARSGGVKIAQLMRLSLRGYMLGEVGETHAIRLLGSVFLGFSTLEAAGSFDHSQPKPEDTWQVAFEALDAMLRSLSDKSNI